MATRRRKTVFAALAVVISSVVALICGEIIVRIFANTYSIEDIENSALLYRPALFTRHRLVPNRTVLPITGDPADAVHINRRGFRGPDFSPTKSPGTVRILFLGGSAVHSFSNGPGRGLPYRVAARLRARGVQAECINAGVPGHDTTDSVGKLLTELWMYQPDYVVLYQGYNDQKYFTTLDSDLPYRDLRKPYQPDRDPQTHVVGLDRLLCRSKLYLEVRYRYLQRKYTLEGLRRTIDPQEPADEFKPLALEQYRLNVQCICDLARNIGAQPLLCKQARLVHPDNTPEELDRLYFENVGLTHEAWCRAFAECDRIIDEVAAANNVPVIDASSRVTGNPAFFHDHIHLTDAGEEAVGRVVAAALGDLIPNSAVLARAPTAAHD